MNAGIDIVARFKKHALFFDLQIIAQKIQKPLLTRDGSSSRKKKFDPTKYGLCAVCYIDTYSYRAEEKTQLRQ